MKYHVIDSDNYVGSGIEVLLFPGGEPHAKVPNFVNPVLFVAKCRSWVETGYAACVADALDRQGIDTALFVPYFPGARQDRSDGTAPNTRDLVSGLFGMAHTFDIHSQPRNDWYPVRNWMPSDLPITWPGALQARNIQAIIAPDEGAVARAENFRLQFFPNAMLVECTKQRDPQTGKLSNYVFPFKRLPDGDYIVVDDICDGGGTFNLLADAAPKNINLHLFVSHGIFSRGVRNLSHRYRTITTTDSWFSYDRHIGPTFMEHEDMRRRLNVAPLKPLYDKIMEYAQ